jgi:hypothetical protein
MKLSYEELLKKANQIKLDTLDIINELNKKEWHDSHIPDILKHANKLNNTLKRINRSKEENEMFNKLTNRQKVSHLMFESGKKYIKCNQTSTFPFDLSDPTTKTVDKSFLDQFQESTELPTLLRSCNRENETIHNNFIYACKECDKPTLLRFINEYDIDVNHDDGYYNELVAARNDLELLKVMLDAGADIKLNNYGILRTCSRKGYLELLDYVVTRYNVDCSVLLGTSAYNNYKCIKEYIDNNIKNHHNI